MKGRRALAGVAALAALIVSFAADAAAAPLPSAPALFAQASRPYEELAMLGQGTSPLGLPRHSALSEFEFTNHDGYTISVVGIDQTVALSVSRKHGHARHPMRSSATTYLAHGKVTSTSIEASFADRGRIEVHFRPTGPGVRADRRAGCRKSSNGTLGRPGVFVGELSFRGEGGYTSADVHRVHGGSIDFRELIACLLGARRHGPIARPRSLSRLPAPAIVAHLDGSGIAPPGVRTHPTRGPRPTSLFADRKLPLARTVFGVRRRGKGRTRFLALDESSAGSIGIIRVVTATGSRSSFSFDEHLSHAEVVPPAPFSGEGAFQHGPGGEKSWTGALAVSFLGAPRTPLTGAPFRAQLVQGW
jgi:hypothetical protein